MKSDIQDTQSITKEKPGTLINADRWSVESDSLGKVKVQADRLWGRKPSVRWNISASAGT